MIEPKKETKSAGPATPEEKKEEKENLKKILEEKEDRYLRLLADFDNFRKRQAAEREEIVNFANEVLISSLLSVLDNFERAIVAMSELMSNPKLDEFLKGIALVHQHMLDTFIKLGLEEIQAIGKHFDPNFHEAALERKDPKHSTGTVVEVLQKGYLFKGKVIRPTMAVVAKNE